MLTLYTTFYKFPNIFNHFLKFTILFCLIFFVNLCIMLKDADMAELADAIDLGSIGRPWGFKSLYPHQRVWIEPQV